MKLSHLVLGFAMFGGAAVWSGCVTDADLQEGTAQEACEGRGVECHGVLKQNPDGSLTCIGHTTVSPPQPQRPPVCWEPQG